MNVIARLEYGLTYNDFAVHRFNHYTTRTPPLGLMKWKRMLCRIKTASTIFQRAIEQILGEDIKNMVCYQDDIYIGATNENELKMKIDIVLNRLRNAGITINEKTWVNNGSKISFLGYTISKEGISPNQALIEKILKIATPKNKKELESFWRLVNFYRRHVLKYTNLEPFANLRKKYVEFIWSEKQQKAFDR